ncbi:F0F1 ATP synthase subunit gamma, partial [Patescibacteria group bacterium]|nr:F0F1 ATP synthase subunit gamma [Patescibacteria group bacterium]
RSGQDVIQSYPQSGIHPHRPVIYPIVSSAIEGFLNGEFDEVRIFYTRFISFLRQEPGEKLLIPMSLSPHFERPKREKPEANEFLFEPTADTVLAAILPRIIETQIYQALLEALASEHAARRLAMQNATDNATDVINDLTLTYNGLRQNAITQEIAEITGGAAALAA